jgi:hypothetical protein
MWVPVEVRRSTLHGHGVFALQRIRRGCVVEWDGCYTPEFELIGREEYEERVAAGDERARRFGGRLFAGVFYVEKNVPKELLKPKTEIWTDAGFPPFTFLNHSTTPNLLRICGFYVTAQEIDEGEELTIDYRTFGIESDRKEGSLSCLFDRGKKEMVYGFSEKAWLANTILSLMKLADRDVLATVLAELAWEEKNDGVDPVLPASVPTEQLLRLA